MNTQGYFGTQKRQPWYSELSQFRIIVSVVRENSRTLHDTDHIMQHQGLLRHTMKCTKPSFNKSCSSKVDGDIIGAKPLVYRDLLNFSHFRARNGTPVWCRADGRYCHNTSHTAPPHARKEATSNTVSRTLLIMSFTGGRPTRAVGSKKRHNMDSKINISKEKKRDFFR